MDFTVLKKWDRVLNFPRFVLFVWIVTFAYLIWDNNYTLFIKPEFGFLIYAGLLICAAFLISGFFNSTKKHSASGMVNGLIILLPVIFIFLTGDRTLNSFALSKRTLMPPDPKSHESQLVLNPLEDQKTDIPVETSLIQLIRDWTTYSGKRVSVQGLFHQSREDNGDYALVFRYLITCCAADAIPVGIFIKKEKAQGFNDNDWVNVTGVVNLHKMYGHDVILMSLDTIEKVEKPDKNAAYMFF